MKKRVHRSYELTNAEVRTALWMYLKGIDQPVPAGPGNFTMSDEADGGIALTFIEGIDIDPQS